MKSLASLTALASLALLPFATTLAGCSAGGGGDLSFLEEPSPKKSDGKKTPGDGKTPGSGGGDTLPGEDVIETPHDEHPLVTGLTMRGVVLYQALGISLMWDGAEVTKRTAPVVMGKDALLRVMVRPEAEWKAREVVGRLELYDGSGLVAEYESRLHVSAASDESKLETSLNFDIPGARMTSDLSYRVSLHETSMNASHPGNAANAVWPREGRAQMGARDSRGNFKFTLVPYRYNGRVPDLSEKQIERYRQKFAAYPTPDVEISVRAVVDHSGNFDARGNGWEQLLNKTCNLRSTDKAAKDNYYFGVIVPAANGGQFCGQGCVAGLAPLAQQASDNRTRCGIGLGFTEQDMAYETALHELGHALGREHAPCGLGGQQSDRKYPYPNAGLGVWGWEAPKRKLHHPSKVKDFMSYCQPIWVSDYTYNALFERIAYVNASPLMKLPPDFPEHWRSIVVEMDGSLHEGGSVSLDSAPSGEDQPIELLDAKGQKIREVTGSFYGTHHLPGGSVLVPERDLEGAKAIRIGGETLAL